MNSRAAIYEFKPKEDDSWVWEVTDLNLANFKNTFGFEPNFEEGDQRKITIRKILETSYGWSLTLEEWYFGASLTRNGTIGYATVYSTPAEYADQIFIPAPAGEYLLEAYETLPSEYIVNGLRVTYRAQDYTMIKEYDSNGVLVLESYLDDNGLVCITVEGTFRNIPMGVFEPIMFMAFSITGLIFIIIVRKRISIK